MTARPPDGFTLASKYEAAEGELYFTGTQALVRIALEQLRADARAGLRTAAFVSGYQGSPLGGFDRELAASLPLFRDVRVEHRPGLNEELAATAVMGTQLAASVDTFDLDGVVGIWYGKGPGVDRSGDAFRHAGYAGTSRHGGVLALAGDDPACKSSTVPSSSERSLADLLMPTFFPGTVQEILDLGRHAIACSRVSGLWSAMKVVTAVADGAGSVHLDPARVVPVIPTIERNGAPWFPKPRLDYLTSSTIIEEELGSVRMPAALAYLQANPGINEIVERGPSDWLGIVAAGRVFHDVHVALEQLGLTDDDLRRHGIRLLRLGAIHPLDGSLVRDFARGLAEVLVVEEKQPFVELWVKDALYGTTDAPRVTGKRDLDGAALVPDHGALDSDRLVPVLVRRLTQRIDESILRIPRAGRTRDLLAVIPARTPFFCSGCPHNTGAQAPEGAKVGIGIGCHTLVAMMDRPERFGDIVSGTQMGAEGMQWVGMEPFVTTDHLIQNIGDGTYFHSGALAVRAAIAAGAHMTYKILYNATVGMTGGQDATGALPVPELAQTLLLEGVGKVIITTEDTDRYRGVTLPERAELWPRERIIEAQEHLATLPGVTVLIHDQQCAAEKRRSRKRGKTDEPPVRLVINEAVCEGCGDCGAKSNCLSVQPVETELGRKTRIHQSSCNLDYSCINGDCPSFVSVAAPRRRDSRGAARVSKATGGARRLPDLDPSLLPDPTPIVPADDFRVRMPGIGGTGVVTVAQVLGTAALLEGRHVSGLDQTGLSQKAGPVVSDVRIAVHEIEETAKATAGTVDTYLVLDLLVGLSPANVSAVSPERTVAVVSTSRTPVGTMISRTEVTYPDLAPLRNELDGTTRVADNTYLDVQAITEGLFGDTTTANVLLLGVAHQLGALPLPAAAIEQAIELNGAAVQANLLAFRWGRRWVHDRAAVEAAMAERVARPAAPERVRALWAGMPEALVPLLEYRVPLLVAHQDIAAAQRYVDVVRRVADAEQAVAPGSVVVATSVARQFHRLLAVKDEYEVARLLTDRTEQQTVLDAVGGGRLSYNLHPPFVRGRIGRALGLDHKWRIGSWATPGLRLLARGKVLRGTVLDPFGRNEVRRVERALVTEYLALVDRLLAGLTSTNVEGTAHVLGLAEMIRGYEQIKLDNVARYREAVRTALDAMLQPA